MTIPALDRRRLNTRSQVWTTVGFALLILIPSMLGFANKFRELVQLARIGAEGTFAMTPVVNYLLASLGFFCLFFWAIYHGMFRDLEGPKYAMLENDRRLDEED